MWGEGLSNTPRAIRFMRAFRVLEGLNDDRLSILRKALESELGRPLPEVDALFDIPAKPLSASPEVIVRFCYRHLVVRAEWPLAYALLYLLLAQLGRGRATETAVTLFEMVAQEMAVERVVRNGARGMYLRPTG